jgi:hypothetical protein
LKPTILMYVAGWSQLAPPAAGAAARRLTPGGRREIAIWCLLQVASDGLSLVLGRRGLNNLWVSYLFMPVTGAIALWAISCWHRPGTGRLTLRIAIPLFVVVSAGLTFGVEDPRAYSMIAAPFHALVLFFAALWTFMVRSLTGQARLMQQDWFWILGGLMLFTGTATAQQPIAWYLVSAGREDVFRAVFDLKAAVDILAFAAITRGVLCPLPPRFSGGASLPRSSPLASSSAPSASP